MGIYVLKLDRYSSTNKVFFLNTIIVALWDLGYMFVYYLHDIELIWLFYKISAIGWCSYSGFTLHFFLLLAQKNYLFKKWWFWIIVYLPSLIFIIKTFSGQLVAIDFLNLNNVNFEIQNTKSLWYNLYAIISWTYLFWGLFAFKSFAKKSKSNKVKAQSRITFRTIFILLILSTTTNLVLPSLNIRIIPAVAEIFITFWMIVVWYSIVKYKLMSFTVESAANELISEMKELLFFVDVEGKILKINKFTEISLQYSNSELKDKYFSSLFSNNSEVGKLLDELIIKRNINEKRLKILTKNKISIPVSLSLTLIKDKVDDDLGIIIVGRDITETILLQLEIEYRKEAEHKIQQQNEELKQQNEEILIQKEEILKQNVLIVGKNEQIKGSIRYAKTIQSAILPSTQNIDKIGENFIIYKPKDIVSGDFYWFAEVKQIMNYEFGGMIEKNSSLNKNNSSILTYYFLAVVDCTGHGIPGAFMSMIGSRLLNEIVLEKKILNPAKILDSLRESIEIALRQQETGNKDGMDISLCRFQKNNDNETELLFSGAKNPIYLYIPENQKLEIIKSNRMTIGGFSNKGHSQFDELKFTLKKDDFIYLLTDGIIDQPNSERKRLGTKKLIDLIEQNVLLSFEEQKMIIQMAFEEYCQNQDQRDDVTLIGIKM
jgi:PAS domain S-box-containing protein